MGVVYHSNYFVYFEVARTDFLENYGLKYKYMEDIDIMLPVIEVNCKYKISAKYADKLIIKTKIGKLSPVKIMFEYKIFRESDGALLAEGFTDHAFVSKKSWKPMNLKKTNPEIYEKMQALI